MTKRIYHATIISIFLFLILLPPLQQITGIVPEPQLVENRQLTSRPSVAWDSFISGTFQYQFDAYMNDNYGFRSLLVMTNNQINITVFKVTR